MILMRRRHRLLVTFLILMIFIFITIKGVIYLRIKFAMDNLIADSKPHMLITYDGLDTSLGGGAITLTSIRLQPVDASEEGLQIDRLQLSSNSIWSLMAGAGWLSGESPPPERMNLSLQNANVILNKEMISILQSKKENGQPSASTCDDNSSLDIDPQLLTDMDFKQVSFDLDLSYRFKKNKQLQLEFGIDMHDIESMEMSFELDNMTPDSVFTQNIPNFALAAFNMQMRVNPAFGNRTLRTCAQRKNIELVELRGQLLKHINEELQGSGIRLEQRLRAAIANFYQNWNKIRMEVWPKTPLNMNTLVQIKPEH